MSKNLIFKPKLEQGCRIRSFFDRSISLAVVLVLIGFAATGCVQRRMMIRTDPPGALVYVDDYEIGTTPIACNFTYYGTRKIRLVKDGFETLTVEQPIRAPWYEIPPLDFISDNFVPGEIRDNRLLTYRMTPQRQIPSGELVARAEGLRRDVRATQYPAVVPTVSSVPIGSGPTGSGQMVSAPTDAVPYGQPGQTGPAWLPAEPIRAGEPVIQQGPTAVEPIPMPTIPAHQPNAYQQPGAYGQPSFPTGQMPASEPIQAPSGPPTYNYPGPSLVTPQF